MRFKFKEQRQKKTVQVNSVLSLIFEEFNLRDSVVIGKIRSKWKSTVGELLAAHSIPDRIFKDLLFISVDHPVYSNELSFMKEFIINEINEDYGSVLVRDIRLENKKLDWKMLNSGIK